MFKTMLQMMEQQATSVLEEKEDARSLWLQEWSRLFQKAYEPDSKVVYSSVYAFPMELIAAFDVVPFDFEVAGAMISTTEMGIPTMKESEDRGYQMDVCSFHRTDLGGFYAGHFPEPDLLLTTSYYCDQKVKTNEIVSLMQGKEAFLLYTPAEINKDSIRYVEKQLRQIAGRLEEVAGHKLDEDRLKEVVRTSNRGRRLRIKLMDLLKHKPAPWGGGHMIGFSINSGLFSGTETMERLYEAYIKQLQGRIDSEKTIPENHRLYWFAWFPVYSSSNLFNTLKENAVSVPICETLRVYGDEIDEDNPFEGLALKCLQNSFVGPVGRRTEGLDKIVDEFSLDGALLFATPACRHANGAYRMLKDSVAKLGLPFLMLDVDISDPRGFSPEQTKIRLEGFIELMDQAKQKS